MGVATGCGCKEVYRFPHTTYPYSSCICTFLQQHPYFFVNFLNVFRSLKVWTTIVESGRRRRRKKKKNAKSRFFYFARCIRKIALYSDDIH